MRLKALIETYEDASVWYNDHDLAAPSCSTRSGKTRCWCVAVWLVSACVAADQRGDALRRLDRDAARRTRPADRHDARLLYAVNASRAARRPPHNVFRSTSASRTVRSSRGRNLEREIRSIGSPGAPVSLPARLHVTLPLRVALAVFAAWLVADGLCRDRPPCWPGPPRAAQTRRLAASRRVSRFDAAMERGE